MIVVHAFGTYRAGDFLDDPEPIERLITNDGGWRFTDAIRLSEIPKDPDFSYG